MERLRPVPVEIGRETRTAGGELIKVDFVNRKVIKRDSAIVEDVHEHEASHAGVAEATGTPVLRLTTIAKGNILGSVETLRANGFAAAVTLGRHGDFGDRGIVRAMGLPEESTAATARGIALRVQDGIDEIAKAAAAEGELSGDEVRSAMKDGLEGREVIVLYESADSRRKKQERTRVKGRFAQIIPMMAEQEYEIPKAA